MPLAIVTMSGFTPWCWWPKRRPVRPKPQITSSTMSRVPVRRQISATSST
jgi:hypothetical protein